MEITNTSTQHELETFIKESSLNQVSKLITDQYDKINGYKKADEIKIETIKELKIELEFTQKASNGKTKELLHKTDRISDLILNKCEGLRYEQGLHNSTKELLHTSEKRADAGASGALREHKLKNQAYVFAIIMAAILLISNLTSILWKYLS